MGSSSQPGLQRIRILLVDADRMSGQLIASALKRSRHRFDVIAVARNFFEAMRELDEHQPHVAIIGSELQDGPLTGFRFLHQLCASHPKTAAIMLLQECEHEPVVDAFRAGARAVFSRAQSLTALSKCIRVVNAGQIWASNEDIEFVLEALKQSRPLQLGNRSGMSSLTKPEQDIVRLVAEGMKNRDICLKLKVSEHTVRNYLFRIFEKLGVSSRVELVLYAVSRPEIGQVGVPRIEHQLIQPAFQVR